VAFHPHRHRRHPRSPHPDPRCLPTPSSSNRFRSRHRPRLPEMKKPTPPRADPPGRSYGRSSKVYGELHESHLFAGSGGAEHRSGGGWRHRQQVARSARLGRRPLLVACAVGWQRQVDRASHLLS
jgi:hypothetical protein